MPVSIDGRGKSLRCPLDAWLYCMNTKFQISTYETGDGVPEGEYRLTFQAGQMNLVSRSYTGDLLNGRYSDPQKSEFTLTVAGTDPIDLGTIDLKTTAK